MRASIQSKRKLKDLGLARDAMPGCVSHKTALACNPREPRPRYVARELLFDIMPAGQQTERNTGLTAVQ